jgi:hypothetical protein
VFRGEQLGPADGFGPRRLHLCSSLEIDTRALSRWFLSDRRQ